MALKTATFAHDSHRMTRAGMCFRPAVQDRAGPTLFNMPAVERAFCAPASGGRDDQVGRLHEFSVALQEFLQAASPILDLKMGKVGLQTLGQGLRFVAANRRSTQRMHTNIWPTNNIIVDQNDPARTRLRKRAGYWRADRSAPDNHDGGIQQLRGSSVAPAPVHPLGICALDRASTNWPGAKVAVEQQRLRRVSRSEPLAQGVSGRPRTRSQKPRVPRLHRDETWATASDGSKYGDKMVGLAECGLTERRSCILPGRNRQCTQVGRCFGIVDRERRLG